MIKRLSWILTALFTVVAVLFSVSNPAPLSLALYPFEALVELPVYLFAFAVFGSGFVVGGLIAWWTTSRRYRGKVRHHKRMVHQACNDLEALRNASPRQQGQLLMLAGDRG